MEVEDLKQRFEARGYFVRPSGYFAEEGLLVGVRSEMELLIGPKGGVQRPEVVQIMEAAIHVFPIGADWTLRVTPHGGPHSTRQVQENEVEELVVQHLEQELDRGATT